VDLATLQIARRKNPSLARRLKNAEVSGKMNFLNNIARSTAWQASAFLLERRWPAQFARKGANTKSPRVRAVRTSIDSSGKKISHETPSDH
jgi:hypothetical protein